MPQSQVATATPEFLVKLGLTKLSSHTDDTGSYLIIEEIDSPSVFQAVGFEVGSSRAEINNQPVANAADIVNKIKGGPKIWKFRAEGLNSSNVEINEWIEIGVESSTDPSIGLKGRYIETLGFVVTDVNHAKIAGESGLEKNDVLVNATYDSATSTDREIKRIRNAGNLDACVTDAHAAKPFIELRVKRGTTTVSPLVRLYKTPAGNSPELGIDYRREPDGTGNHFRSPPTPPPPHDSLVSGDEISVDGSPKDLWYLEDKVQADTFVKLTVKRSTIDYHNVEMPPAPPANNSLLGTLGIRYRPVGDNWKLSQDPAPLPPSPAFLFRGLTHEKVKRPAEAQADFQKAAELGLRPNPRSSYPIGQSLQRIQGTMRLQLENIRTQVRLTMRPSLASR